MRQMRSAATTLMITDSSTIKLFHAVGANKTALVGYQLHDLLGLCLISDIASAQRVGAALTYARRLHPSRAGTAARWF
jgi:hypothetical protein